MFLRYRGDAKLFPSKRDIANEDLSFNHMSCSPDQREPKGLFDSCGTGANRTALESGAMAAVWEAFLDIPHFTRKHLSLLIMNNVMKGLLDMIELYKQKTESMAASPAHWTQSHVNSAVIPNEFEYKEELHLLFAKLDEDGRLGGKE
ncbi:hypothetical protein [Bacillus mesophilum]|uniref:Uncharacterized protein n=1 Tax=Bacillus mesophilum TaxID=1071718 RepID=A0A7V7UX07_9BACI|nr:hypothetical protein [Bacillus mesophilum]KAB2335320.1 hypothetical protein F7732_01755 [Bacillus mesophilum]